MLFQTGLQRIQIEGADSLEEVANLPAVVWLKVRNNKSLRGLSNLRSLERLLAQDCPDLGILKLQKVFLVDCHMEEDIRACFTTTFGGYILQQPAAMTGICFLMNRYTTKELGNRYLFHVAVMLMQGLPAWKAHCNLLD